MTTEQMDWLDDERAGRHAADKLVPKRPVKDDGRSRWPFTPNPADSVKPDPMGAASLADRLRAMGAVRTKHQSGETVEWVNAPLTVVVDQAYLAAPTLSEGHDEDTLGKVHAALLEAGITGVRKRTDLISEMQNAGILFRERIADAEDHTHHTREARDQCAAGDHRYAVLLDDAAEREKILRDRVEADEGEREKMFESRAASLDWLWKRGVIDEQRHHELRQQLREEFGYYREPVESGETTMAEEPREHAERRQWLDGYLAGFREGFERAGRI